MSRRDGTCPMGAEPMVGRNSRFGAGASEVKHGAGLRMGSGHRFAFRRGCGRSFGRDFAMNESSPKMQRNCFKNREPHLQERLEIEDRQSENL